MQSLTTPESYLVINAVCCLIVVLCGGYVLGWTMKPYPWYYKIPVIALVGVQGLQGIATVAAFFNYSAWLEAATLPVTAIWTELALAWLASAVAWGSWWERGRRKRKNERRISPSP